MTSLAPRLCGPFRVRLTIRRDMTDADILRALHTAGCSRVIVLRGTGEPPYRDTIEVLHQAKHIDPERNRRIAVGCIVWLVCADTSQVDGVDYPSFGVNVLSTE